MRRIYKIIGFILTSVLIYSCVSSSGELEASTQGEIHNAELRIEGWGIYEDDSLVAKVTSMEWEYTEEGKIIREISITSVRYSKDEDLIRILKFVGDLYPGTKIEINLDGVNWKLEDEY